MTRNQDNDHGRSESRKTVTVAFAANLVIAVAKLGGGLLSGSVAMLAEAAHSVADTVNEVFLFVSLSLGGRPPDEHHPFGYGKERFFWAFLAATFIFVAGAVFSWANGIRALFTENGSESYAISYIVLGVALLAEGTSLTRAVHELRKAAIAEGRSLRQHLSQTKDPTTKLVLFEDAAAVVGVTLAAAGIGLHQVTGDHRWEAAGSITIGFLLAYVAYRVAKDTRGLLLGEAATVEQRQTIRDTICAHNEVSEVIELLTMMLGPHSILVAVRADLRNDLTGYKIEEVCARIELDVREAVPEVGQFFLDPTTSQASLDRLGITRSS